MPIQAIESKRLYRQISEQLRTLIQRGEFPVGSRLPAERDLSEKLGVSRPSLREALIALEVEGYIEVRMGSGIYVCEPPADASGYDLSAEEGPLELIQARAVLEGEVAALAAKTGRKAQFDAVEEAIDAMEADANAGIKPLETDRLFHIRVAEATGNSVLVGTVKRLNDLRLGPLYDQLHSHFETEDTWRQAIEEHREVLVALRAKDAVKARAAMRRHMDIAYKRMTATLTPTPRRAGAASKRTVNPSARGAAPAAPAARKEPAGSAAAKSTRKKTG